MKKRRNSLKISGGFTLVEIIVVLVILAILAAILVPSMVGWITKGEAKTCLSELGGIRRSYQAGAAFLGYDVSDAEAAGILKEAAEEWGGEGETDTRITCPCGNGGGVTYGPDHEYVLSIACDKHGSLAGQSAAADAAEGIGAIWDTDLSDYTDAALARGLTLAEYFQNVLKDAALDSGGGNYAPAIKAALAAAGYTGMPSWRIVPSNPADLSQGYSVYLSSTDISQYNSGIPRGTTIPCTRISLDASGHMIPGSEVTGTTSLWRGEGIAKISNANFKEDTTP